ncbi:eukaryotic translation initiation factor 2D isoform X1 [Vespa velutina]|uniref:eukaryotic translation initiation factor 2D isoform X1 n=1 Tax=Vespa velutina TaxID=202808 RepID=UPI001FB5402E|nr:eukaryotic translation initiation factor 2D isoform X1 [Vespa velutina]
MFIKPFKVKSNNQLKGTERKKLCEYVLSMYSCLTEETVQVLLPKKESITVMRIVTHNGQLCKLYCVARIPLFFQLEASSSMFFPTIYTLWHHPHLLHDFTMRIQVLPKLIEGADLMLPGLVVKEPITFYSYGKLAKGTPVSVNTEENKAPIAVGVTALSSEDMYLSAGRGKCIQIYHVMGDNLCQLGKSPVRPDLGLPNVSEEDQLDDNERDNEKSEITKNDSDDAKPLSNLINELEIGNDDVNADKIDSISQDIANEKEEQAESTTNTISGTSEFVDLTKEMDELLEYCFLKACKTTLKANDLPMLTSNFFKNHLLTACPPDKNIDIKKSRYKKLSVFLTDMKAKGLINTSVTKGVESLLSVEFKHPLLKELIINETSVPPEPVASNTVGVSDCYKVTTDVLPILSIYGYEKGDTIERRQIRECFTKYVKQENLQDGKILKLNPQLAGILKTKEHQETLSMEDGINKFVGRMTHMHQITLAGTTILHKGKLEPIDMRVTMRSGGKKVTLVNNLEAFGINSKDFSKECQNIGASATVTDDPGKKTPSVLVQGNQILYVYKLLTEKYGIKKTYIRGLEFAPKKYNANKKK